MNDNQFNMCKWINTSQGCRDIRCKSQHPDGYRTRCKQQENCQYKNCSFAHPGENSCNVVNSNSCGGDGNSPDIKPQTLHFGDRNNDLRGYLNNREKSFVVEVLNDFSNRGFKRAADVKPSTIDMRRTKRVKTDNTYEEQLRYREKRFGTSSTLQLEDKIKELVKENRDLKLTKDFHRIYDEERQEFHEIKIRDQRTEIHILSKKLQDKNVTILKEKQRNEKLTKENKQLQIEVNKLKVEMERDFIQCQYCVQKFRTNKQMERHHRFDCKKVPQKISK